MRRLFAAPFIILVLVAGGTSYAADADDVKAAVDSYHAAFTSLDLAKIDAVWAHDDTVIDKEPMDKTITVGWEGTRKNFEGMIAALAEASPIEQGEGPHIQVQGDTAWAMGVATGGGGDFSPRYHCLCLSTAGRSEQGCRPSAPSRFPCAYLFAKFGGCSLGAMQKEQRFTRRVSKPRNRRIAWS
jgi:ketosteroid isomerase-like protein